MITHYWGLVSISNRSRLWCSIGFLKKDQKSTTAMFQFYDLPSKLAKIHWLVFLRLKMHINHHLPSPILMDLLMSFLSPILGPCWLIFFGTCNAKYAGTRPMNPIWMFPKIVVPPKSSILIGFSIINHPFWGTPIFGNTHIGLGFSVVSWQTFPPWLFDFSWRPRNSANSVARSSLVSRSSGWSQNGVI